MERLSSCYFCGAALDASLDEYPVVPKGLQPGEHQRTVVLCPTCRRKLANVIETVTDAMETASAGAPGRREGDGEAERSGSDEGEWSSLHGERESGAASSGDSTDDRRGSLDAGGPADGETAAGAGSDSVPTIERSRSNDPGPEDDGGSGGRAAAGNDPSDRTGGATARDAANGSGAGTGGRSDRGDAPDGASAGGADAGGASDDGPSLTALEYNKVMRLLQNREFPVDKGEIRTVALNAYDISEEEFEAIIGAAIDRGLIDERDGQFVGGE